MRQRSATEPSSYLFGAVLALLLALGYVDL